MTPKALLTGTVLVMLMLVVSAAVRDGAAQGAPRAVSQEGGEVENGIDVLLDNGFQRLRGKRVGLITNPTGVTRDLRSSVDVLHDADGVELVALYGPEHGVRGDVNAGDHVQDSRDPATGVPAFSLYGRTRKPTPEMLEGVDVLIYDIQDIGSRSYTYISTMAVAMEAAAENGVAFMVLDRPNPLGGERMEGRPLDPKFTSFVGAFPIPYLYGMTCGELARMINDQGWLANGVKCELTVIPMKGWRRSMTFDQTGLPWVPTSPHIPHARTAPYYAATGIMGELQVISEGVGYTLPFEIVGAPFIQDAGAFSQALNARRLPGVHFRPLYFKPYYIDRVKGKACGGAQIHLIDPSSADLTTLQFHVMDVVRRTYPDVKLFGNGRDAMFDKVCGTDQVRLMFEDGRPLSEILDFWSEGVEDFRRACKRYLMYR